MTLDEALIWYSRDRFTADDVTRATGLSERSQRELLKIGVLQPVPQAKTKTRLMSEHMVKRAAIVAPLNQHGLSLKVSGKIVYASMMLEDFMFDVIDPINQLFEHSGDRDPITKLPPKRAKPERYGERDQWGWINHGWFDPDNPAQAEVGDHHIEITNGRYVSVYSGGEGPIMTGELTADQTDIVVWWGSVWDELIEPKDKEPEEQWTLGGMFAPSQALSPELRKYQWKKPTENEKSRALHAWKNPISKLRVNADLTLRIALRRLLYIDPVE
jgi:hypothetical protein